MKRLSIIVPVYNVENYLAKCLDSLLNQDIPYEEYEIIVVNDGSTDSSQFIVEKYERQYKNILLITQENKGLGGARNTGIRQAKGKCLLFVDSDDYIQVNSLSIILDQFEKNELEIFRFNYTPVNENGELIKKRKSATQYTIYNEKIVNGETFLTYYLGWACYVWVYVFETSFIKNNNLFFNEKIYFEDVEWLIRVLLLANRVKSIDKQIYFYLQRLGSITQSVQIEKKNKLLTDKLFLIQMLKSISLTTKIKKVNLWCSGMISLTIMSILEFIQNDLPDRKKEIIDLLYNQNFIPLKRYNFTIKQIRNTIIINLSPKLYCYFKRKR